MVEQFPINRGEGTVLSSIGLTSEEQEQHREYIGIKLNKKKEDGITKALISKGLLIEESGILVLTDEGERLARRFNVMMLMED